MLFITKSSHLLYGIILQVKYKCVVPKMTNLTDQEGGSLKQQHFIGVDDLCKVGQVGLYLVDIGDQLVHNG